MQEWTRQLIIEVSAEIDLHVLYGSPKCSVADDTFRGMFPNDFFRKDAVAVVFDEVRTVVTW